MRGDWKIEFSPPRQTIHRKKINPSMSPLDIDVTACRGRQRRLLAEMARLDIELAIATSAESIRWLTGAWFGPLTAPVAALSAAGHMTLVVPARQGRPVPSGFAADEIVPYEFKWHSSLRNDQRAASSEALVKALAARPGRIGVEFGSFPEYLRVALDGERIDLEPVFLALRRRKDADEVALLRRAIEVNEAMYGRARELIGPGLNELDLYGELQAVAVRELGEPLTYFGQDFQSNARGGPPRTRRAEAGELWILDLGIGARGYFSDNARTFAVGPPTDAQRAAWEKVVAVFAMVERAVRPGVSARAVFESAQAMLDEARPWTFDHHLGHGVGLALHEGPHLNPRWDDTFAEGDLIAVEPGLYHADLKAGLRLEENYLVTAGGVTKLSRFPLELA